MREKHRSPDQIAAAVARVVAEEKASAIAFELQVSESTLYTWVRAAGYTRRWVPKTSPPRRLTLVEK